MLIASVGKRLRDGIDFGNYIVFRSFSCVVCLVVPSLFESVVCFLLWKCLWSFAGHVDYALFATCSLHSFHMFQAFFSMFSLMFATVFLPHCSMVFVRLF